MLIYAGLVLTAYLIGSIPWAVWLSKSLYGIDVRTEGSKNAGATNTFRVLGKKAGVAVLLLDVAKGVAVGASAYAVRHNFNDLEHFRLLQVSLALIATLGHVYPLFANFKGGKGVATLTGAMFFIFPEAALVGAAVFLAVFLISKFISLSSMSAAVALASAACIIYRLDYLPLVTVIWLVPLLVIYTHRANIKRLREGNENKMYLIRNKR
jgi:acyl phosphate:glycerol-3-phosphate acyltransferase